MLPLMQKDIIDPPPFKRFSTINYITQDLKDSMINSARYHRKIERYQRKAQRKLRKNQLTESENDKIQELKRESSRRRKVKLVALRTVNSLFIKHKDESIPQTQRDPRFGESSSRS